MKRRIMRGSRGHEVDSKIEHGFLNEVKKDMRGEGFEPANDFRADLESASVGHLDTLAKVLILICVNTL